MSSMERNHEVAMAVAETILFLRKNDQHTRASQLSDVACEAGLNMGPIAAAWLEDISA